MRRSNQVKGRREKGTQHSIEEVNEGTAARTRPLSYDEIMFRRKSKKAHEYVKDGAREAGKYNVENVIGHSEHVRSNNHSKDANFDDLKNISEGAQKVGSRKKEEKMSKKEEDSGKRKKRESRDPESKSKHKLEQDMSSKIDGGSGGPRRSKVDERLRENSEHDYEKKHYRDHVDRDRYLDRSRGTSERENKRKDRNEDAEKYRERYGVKKHDSRRRHESELSERREKMESSHSRHEEVKLKRRRSGSPEHGKDKDKRSDSSSPGLHKYVSSRGQEHGDLSVFPHKDRSGRHHSDSDRNKISSNGSSSHYRRHGGSSSGLGGYSPRKRKTEAAVKTPSPPKRSPEKKGATWDLPPARADSTLKGSTLSSQQLLHQIKPPNVVESGGSVAVASNVVNPFSGLAPNTLLAFKNASIDSIQLTQATRPMRRLYIDNVPGSASEKDIMECFNNFLLASGSNLIQGTRPCISCMIHKEKGQALVEFLTPEDASAALTFDGKSFLGCILKIRRPKDFVEVISGAVEKSKAEALSVSDFVKDSSHKIFIGGISEAVSAEMLMEIASVFGQLKSYHFEVNEDLNEPCAFLEYADQFITLKACAGLNGMKLGGRILTVAQAVPNALPGDDSGRSPSYGIPEHVKPLLEKPTKVLKIKNVVDPEGIESLSEAELEEIIEDVRLECARFGSVKSVNIVKTDHTATREPHEIRDNMKPSNSPRDTECNLRNFATEPTDGRGHEDLGSGTVGSSSKVEEPSAVDSVTEANPKLADEHDSGLKDPTSFSELGSGANHVEEHNGADTIVAARDHDDKSANDPSESGMMTNPISDDKVGANEDVNFHESPNQESAVNAPSEPCEDVGNNQTAPGIENNPNVDNASESDEANGSLREAMELSAAENGKKSEEACNHMRSSFEVGSVLVEFRRTEASCMAAHCLHGRLFDERVVSVEYVPYSLYQAAFLK